MNHNLTTTLSQHLQADSDNAIRIQSGNRRLKKRQGSQKFAFTLDDIDKQFGGIDNLLVKLPQNGFETDVQFTLVKMYTKNNKTTYRTFEEITQDLTTAAPTMNTPTPSTNPIPQAPKEVAPPAQNFGLGYLGAPELIGKMVEAERGKDYKKTCEDLEEKLKNANSEIRVLKETNSSLEIKIATAKERAEIDRERDKLNQKSFLDSEGGAKLLETLGAIIPKALDAFAAKTNPVSIPSQLGNPIVAVSPIKEMAIEKIQSPNFSDEQTGVIHYILENWEQGFIEQIMALINKKEQHGRS